ncbi:MAG: NAD-dependent succinate-semialdehyde dehydrogenase [Candidatus Omnitrophica bacterium]|nr:NAD-dependent succinate-semialdehyde dehydrogenase [Candidatus Omnitrophota bacterium]
MIQSDLLPQIASYIDGKWIGGISGKTIEVRNPANGDLLAEVPQLNASEVEQAVVTSDRAFREYPDIETRRKWVMGLYEAMIENKVELGRIITLEHGKPHKEAIVEVEYAAGFFKYYAEKIDALKPEVLDGSPRNCRWTIHHRPAGVAGSITPWNFPLAMFGKKLAPALAAGCGVVAKPSKETPLTAIAVYTLGERIGIPPGQMNLVIGSSSEIGKILCTHPLVRVISCTSSTETGIILLQQSADHIKKLSLELGGNAPYIVCEDADLEKAADALMSNKFRGSGQTCVCANRVFVHKSVEQPFSDLMKERVEALKMGDGMNDDTDIGPLINRAGYDKVAEHLEDALQKGAKKVCGLEPVAPSEDWGAFFPPTVINSVKEGMKVFSEETFGPLVAIIPFETDEEVVKRANDTEFGLAAYVFCNDRDRGDWIIERLQFGHVGFNTGTGPTPEAPFGGMKQSGFGREGGLEGLFEFTEPQTVPHPL